MPRSDNIYPESSPEDLRRAVTAADARLAVRIAQVARHRSTPPLTQVALSRHPSPSVRFAGYYDGLLPAADAERVRSDPDVVAYAKSARSSA